jgi:hypothetical protein
VLEMALHLVPMLKGKELELQLVIMLGNLLGKVLVQTLGKVKVQG